MAMKSKGLRMQAAALAGGSWLGKVSTIMHKEH